MQRWIVLRIDTDVPKVVVSYDDEEKARKVCDDLLRENKNRLYTVVDSEEVDERGYLY